MLNVRVLLIAAAAALAACSGVKRAPTEGLAPSDIDLSETPRYVIGPYDQLQVFVWQSPELSTTAQVRPDGRISTPLVEDMVAAGKTPGDLADDIQSELSNFVRTPEVTVIVSGFSSTFEQQIRVLGEAQRPTALPYQAGMTTLDVMIQVGGLTEFAAGNRAKLIRGRGEDKEVYRLRLSDLLRNGDVSADVPLRPGDVILIPDSVF